MYNLEEQTKTAGAYIMYNGYLLFMFGFSNDKSSTDLGVVRFGGHKENNENVLSCVKREVKEETSLDSEFYLNNIVYSYKLKEDVFKKIDSYSIVTETSEILPMLLELKEDNSLSLMYLLKGFGKLEPSMETQGILLLRFKDLKDICTKQISFKDYIDNGGKYVVTKKLKKVENNPKKYKLIPRAQLLFINKFLQVNPKLINYFFDDNV